MTAGSALSAKKPLRVAFAGLGTVGAGCIDLLSRNADLIAQRAGRAITPVAFSARDRNRDRGVSTDGLAWFADPVDLATKADADVIVEAIGGSEGPARRTVEAALMASRPVVTANKALLAHHGAGLAQMAADQDVDLRFEAAVAGGIPIIKALREGLAGNQIDRVAGILNGTCNFILTTMRETGREFADVLAEAQKLGYAEADPSFDVDGVDAAHKLALLASVAFGCAVDFAAVRIEGIRHVSALDIAYAQELGFRIKLLGTAMVTDDGLDQRVQPCMVPLTSPISQVEGVFNAVQVGGDAVGRSFYQGRGAGAGPTASAVVADLIDIARGYRLPTFGVPTRSLRRLNAVASGAARGSFYIRLMVLDRPGVIADVAATLRDHNVSLEAMLQRGRAPNETVPVVLTTHETDEGALRLALDRIARLESVVEPPRLIQILQEL
jgi:homoserine dehydrogenase